MRSLSILLVAVIMKWPYLRGDHNARFHSISGISYLGRGGRNSAIRNNLNDHPNLVPRVLKRLGQRVVAGKDSGILELLPQVFCG